MFSTISFFCKPVELCVCPVNRLIYHEKYKIIRKCLRTYSAHPEPVQNTEQKVLKVAIIGAPNAGKSTLINNLMDRRVCAVSNKVHTTKTLARAIFTENDTQVVFLDTPGVVTHREEARYKLTNMKMSTNQSYKNADMIGVVHDVANIWHRDSIHPNIVKKLEKYKEVPCFLVLNKIDMMKSKRRLLDTVRTLCNGVIAGKEIIQSKKPKSESDSPLPGYSGFSDVFMVSALEGDGVDLVKRYLIQNAKPGKWLYSCSEWTDQSQESLIIEIIRATFLDFLQQELPYSLKTEMEYLEIKEDTGKVICLVVVTCPSERIEKLIAGAGGGRLRQITDRARYGLMEMFQKSVALTITLRTNASAAKN